MSPIRVSASRLKKIYKFSVCIQGREDAEKGAKTSTLSSEKLKKKKKRNIIQKWLRFKNYISNEKCNFLCNMTKCRRELTVLDDAKS